MRKMYIAPILTSSRLEIISLNPGEPEQASIIDSIRQAFSLPEDELGYEIRIREALSDIWLRLFRLCTPILQNRPQPADRTADKVKQMMIYIHEHYSEKSFCPEAG